MGNREDLLAGAKRCLYEKGYASTTARDIATASGTSLAAIGYHFGSKEALMNQARLQAFGDWTDQLTRALETELDPATPAIERFEAIWTKVIELFEANRPMWLASFEILAQIDRDPQVRSGRGSSAKSTPGPGDVVPQHRSVDQRRAGACRRILLPRSAAWGHGTVVDRSGRGSNRS